MKNQKWYQKYMMTCGILLTAGCLLTGCAGKEGQEETASSDSSRQNVTETTGGSDGEDAQGGEVAEGSPAADGAEEEGSSEAFAAPEPLTVLFANRWLDQWNKDETKYLLNTAYNEATLDDEEAEEYPGLQAALESWSKKEAKRMKKLHKENGRTALKVQAALTGDSGTSLWSMEELASASRADSLAVSLRLDYQDYLGGAHGMYSKDGVNFDTETGRELKLSDVFVDVDGLQDVIEKRLIKKYKRSSFYSHEDSDSIWVDYGKEQSDGSWKLSEEDYTWWMTPEGVTFYFAPYAIAPYAGGDFFCTIAYSEEKYVKEKYAQVSEQYMRELTFNDPEGKVEIDLDDDGQADTLQLSAKSGEYDAYESLTIKINKEKYKSKVDTYNFVPLLVHTKDGKNYLYIQFVHDNDYKSLHVFDLSGGAAKEVGELYAGYYSKVTVDDYYTSVPADPESFKLATRLDALSTYDGWKQYHVGADGMPEAEEEYYQIQNDFKLTSKKDLEVSMVDEETGEETEKELVPKGSKYRFYRTDGKTYVDMKLKDGRICRLHIELGGENGQIVEGKKLDKCFKGAMFAG